MQHQPSRRRLCPIYCVPSNVFAPAAQFLHYFSHLCYTIRFCTLYTNASTCSDTCIYYMYYCNFKVTSYPLRTVYYGRIENTILVVSNDRHRCNTHADAGTCSSQNTRTRLTTQSLRRVYIANIDVILLLWTF